MGVFPKLAPRPLRDGGFQSQADWDAYDMTGHPLLDLRDYLYHRVYPSRISGVSSILGFINVNYQIRQPTEWHDHPEIPGGLVAVVYVFSPVNSGGELEFRNPSYRTQPSCPQSAILFPASWEHRVLPYRNYFRLSIAFNIGIS